MACAHAAQEPVITSESHFVHASKIWQQPDAGGRTGLAFTWKFHGNHLRLETAGPCVSNSKASCMSLPFCSSLKAPASHLCCDLSVDDGLILRYFFCQETGSHFTMAGNFSCKDDFSPILPFCYRVGDSPGPDSSQHHVEKGFASNSESEATA